MNNHEDCEIKVMTAGDWIKISLYLSFTVIFLALLKLTGLIAWSWWWIFAPWWFSLLLFVVLCVLYCLAFRHC